MGVPDLIPIKRVPGHRTEMAGRWQRGQFFGYVTRINQGLSEGDAVLQRVYSVLHEFDTAGTHLDTTIEVAGETYGGQQAQNVVAQAERLLDEWMKWLPDREFGDIVISPFTEMHDGVLFGLVVECHGEYPEGEEVDDWAEFYPIRLGFGWPWDGSYST
ncbi:hypothetical protein ACQP1O_15170 [Nocardia sp. CA-151230]|uniref:hypothetical protein n=1 Tax=Nocardia sp. CA-151230 TaxID=3239982 RepID=UPI003D8D73A0